MNFKSITAYDVEKIVLVFLTTTQFQITQISIAFIIKITTFIVFINDCNHFSKNNKR